MELSDFLAFFLVNCQYPLPALSVRQAGARQVAITHSLRRNRKQRIRRVAAASRSNAVEVLELLDVLILKPERRHELEVIEMIIR